MALTEDGQFVVRDFTFDVYERVLETLTEHGYETYSVASFLEAETHPDRYAIVRHDVDRRPSIARSMAHLEAEYGVEATYYLRTSTFSPEFAHTLVDLGHEVGYHYEDLARAKGNRELAYEEFERNLDRFREHVEVTTACSHGSPLSPHLNTDMWDDARPPERYGLTGIAYGSIETDDADPQKPTYVSDTGRHWGVVDPTVGRIDTTEDLIELLESGACPRLYVLAHPSRWARSRSEFVERVSWDVAAEAGKRAVVPLHRVQGRVRSTASGAVRAVSQPVAMSRNVLGMTPRDR
ncbi:hypothetical protein ACLI4Y_00285 [Natrialbaceae archaeon A-CW3]